MKTPNEARACWCPFARVSRDGGGNRYPQLDDAAHAHAFARCIAEECMAWRWDWNEAETKDVRVKGGGTERVTQPKTGFCGLAG